jgi:hypothetical protein
MPRFNPTDDVETQLYNACTLKNLQALAGGPDTGGEPPARGAKDFRLTQDYADLGKKKMPYVELLIKEPWLLGTTLDTLVARFPGFELPRGLPGSTAFQHYQQTPAGRVVQRAAAAGAGVDPAVLDMSGAGQGAGGGAGGGEQPATSKPCINGLCGAMLPLAHNYCTTCREHQNPVRVPCVSTSCDMLLKGDAAICYKCGKVQQPPEQPGKKCGKCGKVYELSRKYCPECDVQLPGPRALAEEYSWPMEKLKKELKKKEQELEAMLQEKNPSEGFGSLLQGAAKDKGSNLLDFAVESMHATRETVPEILEALPKKIRETFPMPVPLMYMVARDKDVIEDQYRTERVATTAGGRAVSYAVVGAAKEIFKLDKFSPEDLPVRSVGGLAHCMMRYTRCYLFKRFPANLRQRKDKQDAIQNLLMIGLEHGPEIMKGLWDQMLVATRKEVAPQWDNWLMRERWARNLRRGFTEKTIRQFGGHKRKRAEDDVGQSRNRDRGRRQGGGDRQRDRFPRNRQRPDRRGQERPTQDRHGSDRNDVRDRDTSRIKTCYAYNREGTCRFGRDCKFAHVCSKESCRKPADTHPASRCTKGGGGGH